MASPRSAKETNSVAKSGPVLREKAKELEAKQDCQCAETMATNG